MSLWNCVLPEPGPRSLRNGFQVAARPHIANPSCPLCQGAGGGGTQTEFLAVVTSLEPQDGPWAPSLHNAGFVNEAFADLGWERACQPLVGRVGLPGSPLAALPSSAHGLHVGALLPKPLPLVGAVGLPGSQRVMDLEVFVSGPVSQDNKYYMLKEGPAGFSMSRKCHLFNLVICPQHTSM